MFLPQMDVILGWREQWLLPLNETNTASKPSRARNSCILILRGWESPALVLPLVQTWSSNGPLGIRYHSDIIVISPPQPLVPVPLVPNRRHPCFLSVSSTPSECEVSVKCIDWYLFNLMCLCLFYVYLLYCYIYVKKCYIITKNTKKDLM